MKRRDMFMALFALILVPKDVIVENKSLYTEEWEIWCNASKKLYGKNAFQSETKAIYTLMGL